MAEHSAQHHPDHGATRTTGPETVVVHGSDVHVERAHFELPLAEARSRYGGTNPAAVLGGALAGLGTASLLGTLASAIGVEIGQGTGSPAVEELAVGGLAAGIVVLALSGLAAGWVAGRMARFDGVRNGLLAGVVLALLLTVLGAVVTATHTGTLPVTSFGEGATTAAVVGAVVGLLVTVLAALLGGRLGVRWHRDVDDVVVGTRPGAIAAPPTSGGSR